MDSIGPTPPAARRGPRNVAIAALAGCMAAVLVLALLAPRSGASSLTAGSSALPTLAEPPASIASSLTVAAPTSTPTPLPTAPTSFPPLAAGTVPILYMHRAVAPPSDWATLTSDQQRQFEAYDVLPAALAAQLDWLVANGYTTILPRDLAAHWDEGAALPPRPVILTFDDGSASWIRTILPLLQARHMVAEFYLTLGAISDGAMTWTAVRELAAAGMGIGAHDVHHVQLTELGPSATPYPSSEMWFEVDQARIRIGQAIGTPPDSMAYVGGGFDPTLEGLVRQAGYTTARSILRGIRQSPGDRYSLRVIAIAPHDDVIDFGTSDIDPALPTFAAKMAGLLR
jgi:peptidoglycan/xylan/chitin deacetylase (PgdA/CDA1 family)